MPLPPSRTAVAPRLRTVRRWVRASWVAGADAVVVDGLEARDAVGVEAEPVGLDQDVGADGGVGVGNAEADEDVRA
jgi:hypothetical protein